MSPERMSIKLLSAELLRFLGSAEPEVLCITGKWGVGKTYAWNYYLRQAQGRDAVKLKKYAYVSLFGRNALDDVRTAIVENTVDGRVAGKKPDLKSLKSVVAELRSLPGPLLWLASFFPGSTRYVNSFSRALFLTVRKQIVCVDDLERVSSGLNTMNILGLVSSLKEEKSCKVVIILNQDALSKEDKKDFTAQIEKIADTIITFDPTPEEAAEIGIDKTTKFYSWLAECTQALGIVNIRVIKKIEAFCRRAYEILPNHDTRIFNQAVQTLALVVYAKLQPSDAPPLEFIKTYNHFSSFIDRQKDNVEDQNSRFKALLRRYNFQRFDEFDISLVEGVERGFFDEDAVKHQADKLQETLNLGDKANALKQAWGLVRDSFDDNQDVVLNNMVESVKKSVRAISPVDLSEAVAFLKEFDLGEQARELIKFYIDNRQEESGFWNLNNHSFLNLVKDPDVKSVFDQKFAEVNVPRDPVLILKHFSEGGGWNQEDLDRLAGLNEADYVRIFKRLRGPDLKGALNGALVFREIANADDCMESITRTVESALRQIGKESLINAKRVKNWGIKTEKTEIKTDSSETFHQE